MVGLMPFSKFVVGTAGAAGLAHGSLSVVKVSWVKSALAGAGFLTAPASADLTAGGAFVSRFTGVHDDLFWGLLPISMIYNLDSTIRIRG